MEIGENFMIKTFSVVDHSFSPKKNVFFRDKVEMGRDGVGVGVRVRVRITTSV